MKKIASKEEKEKSESRKRRIIVIAVGVIMVLSTLGYSFMSFGRGGEQGRKTKSSYRGIDFNLGEYGWNFEVQGLQFITQYLPEDTENISASIFINAQDYYGKPLYFSYESLQEGVREIESNLNGIASRMQYACLYENCSQYAIKNCTSDNIIIIQESKENETFISQEDNCVTISASLGEIARASDRFLYKILGIN
jgi:hypothetical protein